MVSYCEHFLVQKAQRFNDWQKFKCEACGDMELNGKLEWDKHLQTRKHRNRIRTLKKQENNGGSDRQFYEKKRKAAAEESKNDGTD